MTSRHAGHALSGLSRGPRLPSRPPPAHRREPSHHRRGQSALPAEIESAAAECPSPVSGEDPRVGPSCLDADDAARGDIRRAFLEGVYRGGSLGPFVGIGRPALPMAVAVVEPGVEEAGRGQAGGPGGQGGGQEDPDFYANVGDALLRIRSEIPFLFESDLTYDIYRDDIVFKDPRNSFHGIRNYKIIFWSLRMHGRIFFKRIFVDVKSVCQVSEKEIRMRWTVHGIPRIPWEAEGIFDGVSIYKLDGHGKIYEHEVSNVIFRGPPVVRFPLLANMSLAPRPQQPCPGGWSLNFLFLFQRFSWVRMYLVLLMSMQLRKAAGLAGSSS
eukprot:evm.model.scf_1654.2 EVM.evm.TU.scf_1654.2   scf_1654:19997-24320(+)